MEETIKKEFKQFAMATDYSDHHYHKTTQFFTTNNSSSSLTKPNNNLSKKIMQEWSILEKHLPETIFVRAYEGRINFLRAAIVGANGTPYHDNIFFFDIAFPSDYPNTPPQVYYHSHGLRLNPNLYDSGYVCLSLLNTWKGSGNEKWVYSESSILQVLVSLQGLVLNEKPYYNEPGTQTSTNESNKYNNNVFILSCKTMLYNLKNPPKNFEGLVLLFFRVRANVILKACKDYINGDACVGYNTTSMETNSKPEKYSQFIKELSAIYKKLEEAFQKNGIAKPKEGKDKVKLENEKVERKRKPAKKNEVEHEYFTRSKAKKVKA